MLACKSFFSASLVIAFAAIDVNIPGDFNLLLMMKEKLPLLGWRNQQRRSSEEKENPALA